MINFSKIPKNTFVGEWGRILLKKIIPSSRALPILQGCLRGKKWIVGSGDLSYWLGSYEAEKQKLMCFLLKEGNVFYDIGAHAGFYTLLASKLVGPMGRVFAFEPSGRNFELLKKHVEINGIENAWIFNVAVAGKTGTVRFDETSPFSAQFKTTTDKAFPRVRSVSIDDLVYGQKINPPDFLKIDTEGSEAEILKGGLKVLKNYSPSIFLSTHSESLLKECLELLKNLNYTCRVGIGRQQDEILAYHENLA